jgi:hypothetical protein
MWSPVHGPGDLRLVAPSLRHSILKTSACFVSRGGRELSIGADVEAGTARVAHRSPRRSFIASTGVELPQIAPGIKNGLYSLRETVLAPVRLGAAFVAPTAPARWVAAGAAVSGCGGACSASRLAGSRVAATSPASGGRRELAGTRRVASQAEAAFNAGNLDERSYVDLVGARLTKEQEIVTIEQSLLDQQVAIATLIGTGMPAIALPQEDTMR